MFLDIVFAVAMVFAIFKGYSKGLIIALFSVAGFIIGLAAALKLSAVVASYGVQSLGYGAKWMPFLAFIVVMLLVMLLVRLIAKAVQRSFEHVMLGWANRIGGVLLFAFIYATILSVIIFFLRQTKIISDETAASSLTYPFLKMLGPIVIDGIGKVIPVFQNVFSDLKQFFGKVAGKAA